MVLFNKLWQWNKVIKEQVQAGRYQETLKTYQCMTRCPNVEQDSNTLASVLKACGALRAVQQGKQIHASIITSGMESNSAVANSLIHFYGKCSKIGDAFKAFDIIIYKNEVSYNSMIACYTQNNLWRDALRIFTQMQRNMEPNLVTLVTVIPTISRLRIPGHCFQVHCEAARRGYAAEPFVCGALLDMYSKLGKLEFAQQLFDKMPAKTDVAWNTMIAGHAQCGDPSQSLDLFRQMKEELRPSSFALAGVLSGVTRLEALKQGMEIHGYCVRRGLDVSVFVGNSLIDMYAKCGKLDEAFRVFDDFKFVKDVVTWSTVICAYAQNGCNIESIKAFQQMVFGGISPNAVTVASVLPACSSLEALKQGLELHGFLMKNGFDENPIVRNALIDMYGKCGKAKSAKWLFVTMVERTTVSWNTMIAGHAHNEEDKQALSLFREMLEKGIETNLITIAITLSSCARLGVVKLGKSIHAYMIKRVPFVDVFAWNSLLEMYAKCGCIDVAERVFCGMLEKDVVSWTVMMLGHGMHGHGQEAIDLFEEMQKAGLQPDHVTFVAILSSCSHLGLVDEGWKYFHSMEKDHNIVPRIEHYACMVDLLGRAGLVKEAYDFIEKMPIEPDSGVWGALVGACRIHGNLELAEIAADRLFKIDPDNAGYWMVLSNTFAAAGRWEDVARLKALMDSKGIGKNPGSSWVEFSDHSFQAYDKSYKQPYGPMYSIAGTLDTLKEANSLRDSFGCQDVEEYG